MLVRLPGLLTFAALLAGCVTTAPVIPDTPAEGYPNHSADQIIAAVGASVAPIQRIAADGDLTLEGEINQSATFSLRSRLADSTTVVVRGPLGITGGRALVTADSVFYSNPLADEFLIGPLSAADRFVPGASTEARVVRAGLGLLVPEADVAWTLTAQDGLYQLTGQLPGGVGSRAYTVDPALWRVVRVIEFGTDGRQAGVQEASMFETVDGVAMPRRVRLEGAGSTVTLDHTRIQINPDDLRLRFVRPEGYEVIVIQ